MKIIKVVGRFITSTRMRILILAQCTLMILPPLCVVTLAQVTTSITSTTGVGSLGTDISTSGAHTTTIRGGTHHGQNLFHSFENFSVGSNHTADFVNNPNQGSGIANILSRVTGDNPSNIYGTIKTTNFGDAAFWLFNPHGIVVGPGATFDIKGPINLSTANYLQFDGKRFNADKQPVDATLVFSPTAWGFLGAAPTAGSTIQIKGGTVGHASTLTLVGRDVVDGSGKTTAPGILLTDGTLKNFGGTVKLGSVGKLASGITSGEVAVSSLAATGFEQLGSVRMKSGAGIDVTAATGGAIFIRGNHLVMEAGSGLINKTTNGLSGGVTIDLTGDFKLDDRSFVYSPSFGTGAGGTIDVTADRVFLTNGSFFYAPTFGKGTGGALHLMVNRLQATDSFLYTGGFRFEDDGTDEIKLGIPGVGKAGSITIEGKQGVAALLVDLNKTIVNTTGTGTGGGDITITANDLRMMGGGLVAQAKAGNKPAGNITLKVETLTTEASNTPVNNVVDPGDHRTHVVLSSTSKGAGPAGTITIRGLNGKDPAFGTISLSGTNIASRAIKTGAGGTIDIASNQAITLTDVLLSTSVNNLPSGPHNGPTILPKIMLTTPDLKIYGPAVINRTIAERENSDRQGGTIRAETIGSRDAGDILLKAEQLTIDRHPVTKEGVKLSSNSTGSGKAGTITIDGLSSDRPLTELTTVNTRVSTESDASSGTTGAAGAILFNAPEGTVHLDRTVLRATVGKGGDLTQVSSGADITVTTKDLTMTGGGLVAQTHGSRNAGNITLNVGSLTTQRSDTLVKGVVTEDDLRAQVVFSSSSRGLDTNNDGKLDSLATGNAGTITIRGLNGKDPAPGTISLSGTNIVSRALGTGAGGTIDIASNRAIILTDVFLNTDVKALPPGAKNDPAKPPAITLTTPDLRISGPAVNNTSDEEKSNPDRQGGKILAETGGSRDAGGILLKVGQLTVDRHPVTKLGVRISANSSGSGKAGNITIEGLSADQPLTELTMADARVTTQAGDPNKGTTGAGGEIRVNAPVGTVRLDRTVLNATVGQGGDVTQDPSSANITVTAKDLTMTGGGLVAQTHGSRNAGNITLNVESLTTQVSDTGVDNVVDPGVLRTHVVFSSTSKGAGDAGTITIRGIKPESKMVPGPISLSGTNVFSRALDTGAGGTISIASNQAITLNDVFLNTSVNMLPSGAHNDSGKLPTITLTTPDLRIDGRAVINRTAKERENSDRQGGQILAETIGSRHAGNILLNVEQLTIDRHPVAKVDVTISSSSTGRDFNKNTKILGSPAFGNAGTITIRGIKPESEMVPGPILIRGARIQTQAFGTGEGGPITIQSASDITLTDTVLSANVTNMPNHSQDVQPGNILVTTPKQLAITGGGITAQTTGSRKAGNIALNVGSLTTEKGTAPIEVVLGQPKTDRVVISSSSELAAPGGGAAGIVRIGGADSPLTSADPLVNPISLFPTASVGTIMLSGTDIKTEAAAANSNAAGGPIMLAAAKDLSLTDSNLSANVRNKTGVNEEAANVVVLTPGKLVLTGSRLTATTLGTRDAGAVILNVGSLETAALGATRSLISSSSELKAPGGGAAGIVRIGGVDSPLLNQNGKVAQAQLSFFPKQATGSITLSGTDIKTEAAAANSNAAGGPIMLAAAKDLSLTDSNLSANVRNKTGVSEEAANVVVLTPGKLVLTGSSLTATTSGTRDAGAVILNVGSLETAALGATRSLISSSSELKAPGGGAAGIVRILGVDSPLLAKGKVDSKELIKDPTPSTGNITLTGTDVKTDASGDAVGGSITIGSGTGMNLSTATISSTVNNRPVEGGTSNPADIVLSAPSIRVVDSKILADTTGSRGAGAITLQPDASTPTVNLVTANSLTGQTKSLAANATVNPTLVQLTKSQVKTTSSGSGSGGRIKMDATNITIADRTEVSASSAPISGQTGATGAAGSITMTAANQYLQSGGAKVTTETTGAASQLSGGGGIQISADKGDVSLTEGARISASSKNDGSGRNLRDAGSITLSAGRDIQMRSGATIETDANAALGGKILLTSSNFFHAHDSTITSSVDGAKGSNAGTIDITGQRFQLFENTHINTTATQGDGGKITFKAGVSLQDANSKIDTHSETGRNGTVDIQAPVKVLSGTIVPVRPFFAQAALSTDHCSADPAGKFSSFTQGKRDGLPLEPGRFAPSPLSLEQLEAPGHVSNLDLSTLTAQRFNFPTFSLSPQLHSALASWGGCGRV